MTNNEVPESGIEVPPRRRKFSITDLVLSLVGRSARGAEQDPRFSARHWTDDKSGPSGS